MRTSIIALYALASAVLIAAPERSPSAAELSRSEIARESRFYALDTFVLPEGLKLEVSGLASLPDGRLALAVRKGEVWILDHPTEKVPSLENTTFTRFASGLHEPPGLTWHHDALYTTQRSEVTRLRDTDGDGVADEYHTAAQGWGVSGNYHEYAYGPVFDRNGDLWVTLNCTIGKAPQGDGFSEQKSFPWRGWSMRRSNNGPLLPVSAGLRSPAGLGTNHLGDVFATDQQAADVVALQACDGFDQHMLALPARQPAGQHDDRDTVAQPPIRRQFDQPFGIDPGRIEIFDIDAPMYNPNSVRVDPVGLHRVVGDKMADCDNPVAIGHDRIVQPL